MTISALSLGVYQIARKLGEVLASAGCLACRAVRWRVWLTMVRSCQEAGLRPGTGRRIGAACHNEGSLATVCRGRVKEPEPAAQLAGG